MPTPVEGLPAPNGDDCVGCGRCCHHPSSTVTFLEADEERMGDELLVRLTVIHPRPPHFRFMKTGHTRGEEHCGALDTSVPGHFPCGVYPVRPEGCRTVEAGSPACLEARRLGHLGTSVEFFYEPAASR